jgi:hypothetical protein
MLAGYPLIGMTGRLAADTRATRQKRTSHPATQPLNGTVNLEQSLLLGDRL